MYIGDKDRPVVYRLDSGYPVISVRHVWVTSLGQYCYSFSVPRLLIREDFNLPDAAELA